MLLTGLGEPMTLEQLKMLVSIADAGGILAAAEKLHKTQPTVSVGIKKLEEELGLRIFSRDSYRASLTPAGETLCQQARVILRITSYNVCYTKLLRI